MATIMIPTSSSFVSRASMALSYLSASCPAVAEKKKNGRMNSPAARLARISGRIDVHCADWNVTSTTRAFLKRLSLNAPRNWVRKAGEAPAA